MAYDQKRKDGSVDDNQLRNSVAASDSVAGCRHENVDRPGDIFGETCLDCGLYLNNGAF